jgi:Hypervirulence associated proteins TUDOR domain
VHVLVAAWQQPSLGTARCMSDKKSDKKLSKGDQVEWNSHGSTAEGKVEKKITEETEAGGRKVKASKDEPQYLVKSDKSGGEAVHKPDALKKK